MSRTTKTITEPETPESIIARHKLAEQTRNKQVEESRALKRKLALSASVDMAGWEAYWEVLDQWKALITERGIERDLYKVGAAHTPPVTPIPRPAVPVDLVRI